MNRRVQSKKICRRPGRNRLHSILKMGDM